MIIKKRSVIMALSLMLTISLIGCNNKEITEGEATFDGIVQEVSEDSILVVPLEGEDILKSSNLISVSKTTPSEEATEEFAVGDTVRVQYDGKVAESYPAQVNSVHSISLIQKSEMQLTDIKAYYIRTDGYWDGMEYPFLITVKSPEELTGYYEVFHGLYDLGSKSDGNTAFGWLDGIEQYDNEWFENNQLVMVLLEEASGSIRHQVKLSSNNGSNYLAIERDIPEMGTSDMAEWHILVELQKQVVLDGVMIDGSINLKDKTVYTVDEFTDYYENILIQTAVNQILEEEKETIVDIENPILEQITYKELKDRTVVYLHDNYDPGNEDAAIWLVTFNTTEDPSLGPIIIYMDSRGYVFGRGVRM